MLSLHPFYYIFTFLLHIFNISSNFRHILTHFFRSYFILFPSHFITISISFYRRSEENRLMLRQQTALEILDCDLSMVYKYFPTWIQGNAWELDLFSFSQSLSLSRFLIISLFLSKSLFSTIVQYI